MILLKNVGSAIKSIAGFGSPLDRVKKSFNIVKRLFISYVTSKSGIENAEHIYRYDSSFMSLVIYGTIIFAIVLQVLVPKAFPKEEHHKIGKRLRLLNLVIFAVLVSADCFAKGEVRPEYLIPLLLEIGWEFIHKLFGM